ncbi:uncharacterized protein N7518_007599 [Penicillium psychrosexuale]|uniref:uncharacterized protein n=1 Tax=Penicillium psychrosexuale TaxID=1002107 RepID=UPI00254545A7|nr:uncharacterized protein N7518_007599 [Penicillium psychrosexuale]KAJ5790588.1 hypothetical protein N7518_007599 [Penicillium psychrosexuale]
MPPQVTGERALHRERLEKAISLLYQLLLYFEDGTRPYARHLSSAEAEWYIQQIARAYPRPFLPTHTGTSFRFPPDWPLERPQPIKQAIVKIDPALRRDVAEPNEFTSVSRSGFKRRMSFSCPGLRGSAISVIM